MRPWGGNQCLNGIFYCHGRWTSVARPSSHPPAHTLPPCYASQQHSACLTAMPYPLLYPSIVLRLSRPFLSSPSLSYSSSWLCLLFCTRSCPVLADSTRCLIFRCVRGCLSMHICHVWVIGPDVDAGGAG